MSDPSPYDAQPGIESTSGWSWKRPFGRWTVLLAILFFPVVPAYILTAWGWLLADRALQPRHVSVETNELIRAAQTARTVVGFVVVAVLYLLFTDVGLDGLFRDLLVKALWTMGVGLLVLTAGIAMFAGLAGGLGRREIIGRGLRYPTEAMLLAVGTAGSFFAFAWLSTADLPPVVYWAVLAWGVLQSGFTLRAMFLLSKNVFNAVEVHALLPPVLAPCIAWLLVLLDSFQTPVLPRDVHLIVSLSGAGAVTLIAVVEWFALRRENPGLSVQDGRW